jgi:nucleotide-binding universal stress UspA family protein
MSKQKKLLFGLDESGFAKQALQKVGGLLKDSQNLKITLFHGASKPDLAFLPESIGQEPVPREKIWEHWESDARQVLANAGKALMEAGFDPDRTSSVFDAKCRDPADSLLKLALQEGIDTLAVARWGTKTVSRQMIGPVTYRLSLLAENMALWVIDPRICSHNVLVCLVGAPVSQRVVDYTIRYFSHLRQSKFTFLHVTPPMPPQYWEAEGFAPFEGAASMEGHEKEIAGWLTEYTQKVKDIADYGKMKLIEAGIPAQNIDFKLVGQKKGIARDIILELEEGDHGILVLGRKGFKGIKEFALGSKAHKLLVNGRAFIVCLVN